MAARCDFTSVDPTDTEKCQAPRQGSIWVWTMMLSNFDAAGIVARAMWRKRYRDVTPAFVMTEADGDFVWVSRGGVSSTTELQVFVTSDRLALIKAGNYFYDLEFVPNGDETLVDAQLYGEVLLLPEVTK